MRTVKSVLVESIKALSFVDSPKVEAEWILSKILNIRKNDLIVNSSNQISEDQYKTVVGYIARRKLGEPLQYILGFVEFGNCEIASDKRALIPRFETEQLVEMICLNHVNPENILDLGSGSGAISIALAKHFTNANVVAVDFSKDALDLARENAKHNVIKNVKFMHSDWFSKVEGNYDIIVSNPPYLSEHEWKSAKQEIKDFEPRSALIAADAGMADLKRIIEKSIDYLTDNGCIYLEIGCDHSLMLKKFAAKFFNSVDSLCDLQCKNRFLILKNKIVNS